MHGRLPGLTAMLAGLALAGCAANTMVFGTTTTLGVDVGVTPQSTPAIAIGFKRQEAVVMPLYVAGDLETQAGACDSTDAGRIVACKFLAENGGGARDSYSVLASFGTSGTVDAGTGSKVGGDIAQYFSTGVAAQILAAKGGAALVGISDAATASAEQDVSEELSVILDTEAGQQAVAERATSQEVIAARFAEIADADFPAYLAELQRDIRSEPDMENFSLPDKDCTDRLTCVEALKTGGFTSHQLGLIQKHM